MFKEEPNYMPELGQMLLSNNNFFSEEAYWATEGLVILKQIIDESKILDWEDIYDYEGKKFAYRNYCWCDGDTAGHEMGCPPNFEHYESGLQIAWYKHCGRGVSANKPELKMIDWFNILKDCVKEIEDYEFN